MAVPLILAIDTSCDDTSAAVTSGFEVMSNVVASQTQLHKQYGGVFPTVAKLAHAENLRPTVTAALKRAGVTWHQITAIAVTQGPGLAPALEVGIRIAKELSLAHQKPLIPINHIEGHVLSVLAGPKSSVVRKPQFPALSVIVSGKHTEFILVTSLGTYQKLGGTVDDAAGEALDKVGRMLDLGYPAAPVMEQFGRLGNERAYHFPLPMTTSGDYNLSFSGLKTAARNRLEKLEAAAPVTQTQTYDFCASFQRAVFRAICYKLEKVLQEHQVQEIWLGGGVAANTRLRKMLRSTIQPYHLQLRTPYTKKLCGDNAAMIGLAAKLENQAIDFERQPRFGLAA